MPRRAAPPITKANSPPRHFGDSRSRRAYWDRRRPGGIAGETLVVLMMLSAGQLGGVHMRGQERPQSRGITARHAAFGRDAVDARVTPRRRETRPVARRIVVMHKTEIKLRLRMQPEL